MITPGQADAAIEYASERGASDGANAAHWFIQDSLGGRTTGDVRPTARRILKGIEDDDPIVLDTFPFADLLGGRADTLTGPELVGAALYHVHADTQGDEAADIFMDICDAYEVAFSDAVEDAIAQAARDALAERGV